MSEKSQTVAILGASADHRKFGNKSVRAHLRAGWRVVPVNPRAAAAGETIEGLPAVATLAGVGAVDRISVYLPPELTAGLLDELAAAGSAQVFFNPGSADPGLLERARDRGIAALDACSIVDLGLSPSQFP